MNVTALYVVWKENPFNAQIVIKKTHCLHIAGLTRRRTNTSDTNGEGNLHYQHKGITKCPVKKRLTFHAASGLDIKIPHLQSAHLPYRR